MIRPIRLGIALNLFACFSALGQDIPVERQQKAMTIGHQLAQEAATTAPALFGEVSSERPGVLIAEGDSWFDYTEPRLGNWRTDVLRVLDTRYGWDVRSVAHFGHTLESMTYEPRQLAEVAHEMERLRVRGEAADLRAILLSAGGNDIAGPELALLLNHARAEAGVLDETIVSEVIDIRLANAWMSFLTALTDLARAKIGRVVPIVIHGYDDPVPDGRGWLGGGGPFPGPWLEPAFTRKGYGDLVRNRASMKKLIQRYDAMVERVARLPQFDYVRLIRTEGLLKNSDYKADWTNELHPSPSGFRLVAGCIHRSLVATLTNHNQKIFDCSEP